MGKLKDAAEDWLSECGYSLGYERDTLPEIKDWNIIKLHSIKVWEYYGKTYNQYYKEVN